MIEPGGALNECRLFLRPRPSADWKALADDLEIRLALEKPACVLLPEIAADAIADARALVARIQNHDVAAIVRADHQLAVLLSADGVHVSCDIDVGAVRRRLPEKLALGVECPPQRHAAMLAGDAGADYIAVRLNQANASTAMEFFTWWGEMMVLPSVALVDEEGLDLAGLRSVADFVSPP